jgi:hypothetical protein
MWRKPWLVSAINEKGRVVDTRSYLTRRDARRQRKRMARRHPGTTTVVYLLTEQRFVEWETACTPRQTSRPKNN